LPALPHDPNRPEDVLKVDADENGNGWDDAADYPPLPGGNEGAGGGGEEVEGALGGNTEMLKR
jgi:hypothetical protein